MTNKDDEPPLKWTAEPGEEIEVLTAEFCDHFGGCETCPGVSNSKELGLRAETVHTVFCTHWCHQAAKPV